METPALRIEPARRIARRLQEAGSIAIATHRGGDGDGWGSACAIAHHFGSRGTDVNLLAATPYPDTFRFLLPAGVEPLAPAQSAFAALQSADVQLVVDASERSRLGEFARFYQPQRTIVIDHHAVARDRIEAQESLIDDAAAATAELIYDVLIQTGEAIGAEAATALYVGLVTDTGSFRYSNSSPHAHRLAASLIEAGADPETLYRPLFGNLTIRELQTLRAVLDGLQYDEELGITWAAVGADIIRRVGAVDEYEAIMDYLRNLSGTEVAVLLRELEDGTVKVSFRSTGTTDVAALARSFGGGGHKKAAGATLPGPLAPVTDKVLKACRGARSSGLEAGT